MVLLYFLQHRCGTANITSIIARRCPSNACARQANPVVINPYWVSVINALAAFQLPASALITLTQYGFITTGLACLAQALLGHRRA
jgi:hypothetical protein